MISEKWKNVAKYWLGNEDGIHCHWCEYIEHDDGSSYCIHKQSKFNDGDRIRGWDGKYCANNCKYFTLSDWYTKDENFDLCFNNPEEKE